MVYCAKCGEENKDGANFCVNCGASLHPKERREKEEEACLGLERGEEEKCFGLPHGGAIAGLVFGVFIIIIGMSIFYRLNIGQWIGPLAIMIVGILIVAGSVYGLSRRKS
jgi:uncharacterized membrane protein YvbJ